MQSRLVLPTNLSQTSHSDLVIPGDDGEYVIDVSKYICNCVVVRVWDPEGNIYRETYLKCKRHGGEEYASTLKGQMDLFTGGVDEYAADRKKRKKRRKK